jgi:DNA topoisomerase-1
LDGEPVTVQNGRYGPYVKKGTDSRSLEDEEQLFTMTIAEAKELFAQPKARGRAAAAPPLREFGDDPTSGRPIVAKEGRWGPYVTDGETNASLRQGDAVESLTPQRAAELLADRRAAGPAAPRRRAPAAKAPGAKASGTKAAGAKSAGAKSSGAKSGAKSGRAAPGARSAAATRSRSGS